MVCQVYARTMNGLTVVAGSLHAIETLVDLVDKESLGTKCTDSSDTVDLFQPTRSRGTR